jgi:hypothetical protein
VLLIPGAALSGSCKQRWKFDWRVLLRMAAGWGTGLLVYLVLPLRAMSNAPVNWGNPVTVQQFLWLVTGDLYQRRLLAIPVAGIVQRLQDLAGLLLRQFELPGIFLALVGLIFFFKPTRLYFITIWNAVVFSVFAVLYASFDSYLYLIPVILSMAIWIGLGFDGLINEKRTYFPGFKTAVVIVFLVFLVGLVVQRWGQVNARYDDRAEQFGAQVMSAAPQNAILFVEDDRAIFALWYFHFALRQRQDITVVVTDLLHFEWYAHVLQDTYPRVNWPEGYLLWMQTIVTANPTLPPCFISYKEQAQMDCGAIP